MRSSERRVVISGIGLVTPLGVGPDSLWNALAEGRSGVRELTAFPTDGLPSRAAGEIPDFQPKTWPKALAIPHHFTTLRKSLKYMARDIQLAVAAAERAFADAGLDRPGVVAPERIGVDLGAGLISTELDELAPALTLAHHADGTFDYRIYGHDGLNAIDPLWLLKYLPNMLACHISILNDCQGPSNSITEADAASNLAISEATRIIARNRADMMVSGGADSKIHPLSLIRMVLLDQMTRHQGDPAQACRPFDRDRDGWVPGEGAGILILEEREHALARQAKVYGEILGCGSGCDAVPGGGIDPEGSGTEIAMRAALRDAGLSPADIGHVNAHGSGSPVGDLAEARAIARVFGAGGVPVTGLKGYFGNLVSGCGAVELLGSLIGVNQGLIPPTLNCDHLDPACPIDVVQGRPRPTENPIFLKTNVTRHGQAAAVIVRGRSPADS